MNKYRTVNMSELNVGDQYRLHSDGCDRFVIAIEDNWFNYVMSGSHFVYTAFRKSYHDVFLVKSVGEGDIVRNWLNGKKELDSYRLGDEEGFSA